MFHAADGLPVSADLHSVPNSRAFLVLCHRSHFHRGEYVEIAPRLAQLGYDCLAIDQRSGMNVLGRANEACSRAKERKLATGYVAAARTSRLPSCTRAIGLGGVPSCSSEARIPRRCRSSSRPQRPPCAPSPRSARASTSGASR